MSDLRAARAAAITRHQRGLGDDFARELPRLLDDLEAIDEKRAAGTGNGTVIGQYPAAEPAPAAVKPAARPAPRRRTRT